MTKKSILSFDRLNDVHVYILLVVWSVLSRIPFLRTFDLVSYDGTYYLNQAKTLFSGHMAGAFPIGYPAVVRIFHTILRDYQTAGMAASFVASVGSVIVVYRLALRFVRREYALLTAFVLALNPLFIRYSLMTMSESVYIFWVLLGLLMYADGKWVRSGLAMGMAVITRPEALAIVGILGLTRIRRPRQLAAIAASFLIVYAVNVAVLSANAGQLVVVSKSNLFGSGAESWRLREPTIDFEGRDEVLEAAAPEDEPVVLWRHYARRLPTDLGMILRYAGPVVLALSLLALRRRRYWFVAAALFPFIVDPLFTPRVEARFILPYLPVLILLAGVAIAGIRSRPYRRLAVALLVATIVVLPVVNRAALLVPDEPYLHNAKVAGVFFRDKIHPGDKVAGRKPYFAFYAGGDYTPIPLAPYEDVMRYLVREDVKVLELHQATIHPVRPPMRPLMYSSSVIRGELRYRQVYFDPSGEMLFERTSTDDPLRWTRLTPPGGRDVMPAWSPDGRFIAFRSQTGDGAGAIYTIEWGRKRPRKVVNAKPMNDQLAWSPDGRRIAFANGEVGGRNLYAVDVETGDVAEIVGDDGDDLSPSWSPFGDEIIFCSDRSGTPEIWTVQLASGEMYQISTNGDNTRPSISPNGRSIAWIQEGRGVVILDSIQRRMFGPPTPRRVQFAPTWSPDGRYIAVVGDDWGSLDIYIMKADGSNVLLLTKNQKRDVMPAWSPDGRRIALASEVDGNTMSIWVIEGLEPYLQRLDSDYDCQVFELPTTQ
jgi:Tol biopolymer transport system component